MNIGSSEYLRKLTKVIKIGASERERDKKKDKKERRREEKKREIN